MRLITHPAIGSESAHAIPCANIQDFVCQDRLAYNTVGEFSHKWLFILRGCAVFFLTMETGQLLVSDPQKAVHSVASSGDRTLSYAQRLRPLTRPQSIGILETRHRAFLHRHSDKCSDSERYAYMGNILPFQPSFFFLLNLKYAVFSFSFFKGSAGDGTQVCSKR